MICERCEEMKTRPFKVSDIFGYVVLGPDGRKIECNHEPPSKWRPGVREALADFSLWPLVADKR